MLSVKGRGCRLLTYQVFAIRTYSAFNTAVIRDVRSAASMTCIGGFPQCTDFFRLDGHTSTLEATIMPTTRSALHK